MAASRSAGSSPCGAQGAGSFRSRRNGPGLGAIIRRAVFGFVLVDAAWLFGVGKYDYGFWMLLLYVALRWVLRRARS